MYGKWRLKKLVWFAIISTCLITSCSSNNKSKSIEGYTISGNTQGTTYQIILAEEKINFNKHDIDSVLADFDTVLSTYIPTSEISKLNASETNYDFKDKFGYFTKCFNISKRIYKESDGAFDPSVFPLIQGWGFFKKMDTPLSQTEVDSIIQFVSFESGKYYSANFINNQVNFKKNDSRFKLDFNAIAQGYSVDVLASFLKKRGHFNFYIEIGGEILVQGKNREGLNWKIGIDTPSETNTGKEENRDVSGIISVTDKAVATSGNYRNFYEKDGKKYAHTLNPKTGFPVEHNLLSATIIANTCAEADAYATVMMVLGVEGSKQFLAKHKNLECILIYSDKNGETKIYTSEGAEKMME